MSTDAEVPPRETGHTPHDWRPARFMVIVAHPDDADFGPAGTAARWIDAGSVGWLVCCTSGDAGGEDPDIDPLELAATREAEQQAAAAIVGYAGVSFLHQPDGALANDLALHVVRRLYLFWPNDANVWVDVTATVGRKIDALRAHATQIREPDKLEVRIREWTAEVGRPVGADAAESFRLVVIEDDEDEGPSLEAGEATEAAIEGE